MNQQEKSKLLQQIMWDYNIPVSDVESLIAGKKKRAGHYTRDAIFKKMLESYSWFTILNIFTLGEIRDMLTHDVVKNLRMPSLRKKYEFIQKRLYEIIPFAG